MNRIELRTEPNTLREIRAQTWNHFGPLRFKEWAEKLNRVNTGDYECLVVWTLAALVNNEPNQRGRD